MPKVFELRCGIALGCRGAGGAELCAAPSKEQLLGGEKLHLNSERWPLPRAKTARAKYHPNKNK